MSRIGKAPIRLPDGVTVDIKDRHVVVSGPKGSLERTVNLGIGVRVDGGALLVERPADTREYRALHGLNRALLQNMVQGVSVGFERVLEIRGVGYRAEINGDKIALQVGHSHPVELQAPAGVQMETQTTSPTLENGYLAATVTLRGIDKQELGDFCANVRAVRPVEPYNGKGIRYRGEPVRKKLGKAGKAGGS